MSARIPAPHTTATRSAAIRAQLTHPVIDADGHALEFGPVYFEYLHQVAGPHVTARYAAKREDGGWDRLTPAQRRHQRVTRPTAWAHPTRHTLDRATAMLPALLRARLDAFGLDFAIVYPTLALAIMREDDEELRRATCRALNVMFADNFRAQADRMTPVATIPAHTPQEAIEELEYAVQALGFKAVMISSNVKRPIPAAVEHAPHLAAYAGWIDTLCVDSPYDYDPLWAKCVELRVAVTSHSPSTGWGSRVTTNHYIYNHVGSFAAAGEAFAKALVLGGVTRRFPTLHFAFLEGGVTWAADLYAGLVGHCGKRHRRVIDRYDPQHIDLEYLADLFREYGGTMVKGRPDPTDPELARTMVSRYWHEDSLIAHELDNLGITSAEDLRPLFEPNFYFGCEADDPCVGLAFDGTYLPFGARLNALLGSDIGHWDVPEMTTVLAEAYGLVEHGLLDEAAFRDFTFTHAARLHAGMNPAFFTGTVVETEVARLLHA
jgi:predicted TIM-barrel fold metal-dependent hydrolase